MRPVLRKLERRGLMFLDSMETAVSVGPLMAPKLQSPYAMKEEVIDKVVCRVATDAALVEIGRIAEPRGSALAFAHPYPVTVRQL